MAVTYIYHAESSELFQLSHPWSDSDLEDSSVNLMKPEPLQMYLGGSGGTGKSRVINLSRDFFNRHNQDHNFQLTLYTGVAAKNISGMTLYSTLCINQFPKVAEEKSNVT